jgi:DNA-directed RNA polymerase subunit F
MPKIVGRKNITISEAKALLDNIEKPSHYQVRTLEYVNKFAKISAEKASELVEMLVNQFEIERSDAIQVVNVMPNSVEELRTFFFTGRKRLITTSQLEEMLKLIDRHR